MFLAVSPFKMATPLNTGGWNRKFQTDISWSFCLIPEVD